LVKARLLAEHELRRRVGLPGEYLDRGLLLDNFGFARAAAIVSTMAAAFCHLIALERRPAWSVAVLFLQGRAVMDWNRVEGNWKQVKGKVKEQWGKLTDDDLDVINGKQEQLEGRLQQRYGYAKDQAQKELSTWFDRQKW
jgi:uncharacterized protein YjbJ (UPF0337 family)